MKVAALLLALLALVSLPAFSQVGAFSIGVGAEGGVPAGDFSNVSSFGIGGMGWVAYTVDPNMTVTGKVGYLSFSNKVSGGPSVNMIPILVGGRYFLMPAIESTSMRSYVAADAGLYSASVSGGTSSTKFGIAPALGAQFSAGTNMNVDIHANYTIVFSDPSSTSWIGFGIGLEFGM
jgi:hypothetical protein